MNSGSFMKVTNKRRNTTIACALLAVFFFAIGFGLFALNMSIRVNIIPIKSELPLSDVCGLSVDSQERIIVGLRMFGKIQVYDNEGNFIRHWSVPTSGAFSIKVNWKDQVVINTARGDKEIVFDIEGNKLLEHDSKEFMGSDALTNYTAESNGDIYKTEGLFLKSIIQTYPQEKVIVSNPAIFSIFNPLFFFTFIATGFLFVLLAARLSGFKFL